MGQASGATLPNRALMETRYIPHPLDRSLPISAGTWRVADQAISVLDRHDVLELGLCLEGSGSYVVEDKVMSFRPGSVVVVNEAECHYSRSESGTTSQWASMFVRPEALIPGIDPHRSVLSSRELCGGEFQNVLSGYEHHEVRGIVHSLFQEVQSRRAGREAAIKGLVWTLMANLHRLPGRSTGAPPKLASLETLAPALDRIRVGFSHDLDLPELAALCAMSPRTFTRRFHDALDDAPMRFLNRFRITQACEQLAAGPTSVLDVSLNVGFNSLAAFNRHFRAITGLTPREWRKRPPCDAAK